MILHSLFQRSPFSTRYKERKKRVVCGHRKPCPDMGISQWWKEAPRAKIKFRLACVWWARE